ALVVQYMSVGLICDAVMAFSLGKRYHRQAVALGEEIGNPVGRDLAYLGIGLHEEALGHYDVALSHYQRAAAGYHETGNIRGWGAATTRIGAVFHHRGDFTNALPY